MDFSRRTDSHEDRQLTELSRFVVDIEAAVDYYEQFLDAKPVSAWPGGAVFDLGGPVLLLHEATEHDEAPGEDHPAFAVDDVDAACERLERAGVDIEWPPADYDWGRSAYLRDPAGNLVELIET